MKKILLGLILSLCFISQGYAVDEWAVGDPAGTRNASDLDLYLLANNAALDRFLTYGRHDCKVAYASASTITVGAGSIVCSNSAGSVRRLRANSTAITATWAMIDTGAEAASTTYYLWAIGDADTATFTVKISLSSTAPGSSTYYKRLGSFYNDASSNITLVADDMYTEQRTYKYLGAWTAKSFDTSYLAATDGFVVAYAVGPHYLLGYTDSSNPPTTQRASGRDRGDDADDSDSTITFPVRKGDYYKVTNTAGGVAIYWIPLTATQE